MKSFENMNEKDKQFQIKFLKMEINGCKKLRLGFIAMSTISFLVALFSDNDKLGLFMTLTILMMMSFGIGVYTENIMNHEIELEGLENEEK